MKKGDRLKIGLSRERRYKYSARTEQVVRSERTRLAIGYWLLIIPNEPKA